MKYLAIAALALAFAGGTYAQEASPLIRYELDNGLDVILHRDDRVPKIAVNISYRVGRELSIDRKGAFANDPQATALQTRVYRTPWTLPEPI